MMFTVDVAFGADDSQEYTIEAESWQSAALQAVALADRDKLDDLRFANVYRADGAISCGSLQLAFSLS